MILDTGICRICHRTNTAAPGAKPVFEDRLIYEGWYAELSFETAPAAPTEYREEIQTGARIRILQNRSVANHDTVALTDAAGNETRYRVRRAYHGTDDDSGERITDLTLEVIEP